MCTFLVMGVGGVSYGNCLGVVGVFCGSYVSGSILIGEFRARLVRSFCRVGRGALYVGLEY